MILLCYRFFTLNIFPYINASILVQLIQIFAKTCQITEGDLEGRRSIIRHVLLP
jgi:preprotein translocase subunit SecY